MKIETERLILRKFLLSDFEDLARINSNKNVCRFLAKILTREESDLLGQKILNHWKNHDFGLFAVDLKNSEVQKKFVKSENSIEFENSSKFIGFIGLVYIDFEAPFSSLKNPKIEIGWRLDDKYWNQGYASEGAKAVLNFGFNELKLSEIIAFTAKTNLASQKVMEKIGMKYDENSNFKHPKLTFDHPLIDHVLYRKTNLII